MGQRLAGAGIAFVGLVDVAATWWFRNLSRPDPILDAALKEAMEVRKTDPAAAHQMLERALTVAEAREEQDLAQLHAEAALDKRAALRLRDRLRGKMKIHEGARRRAQRNLANTPNAAAVLQEIDRMASVTRQRLADAEQLVERLRASS